MLRVLQRAGWRLKLAGWSWIEMGDGWRWMVGGAGWMWVRGLAISLNY